MVGKSGFYIQKASKHIVVISEPYEMFYAFWVQVT